MVSNAKRSRCVSESTSDDDVDYHPGMEVSATRYKNTMGDSSADDLQSKPTRRPTRTPKCFTKNALMARENRLKKKMYITNLEDQVASLRHENKKLSALVDNQSQLISDLKREVKYLKSVISNSEGIARLIKNINTSTGMAVTTSLDKKLTQKTHPWEEPDQKFPNIPTPDSSNSYYSSPDFEDLNGDTLLNDIDLSLDMTDNDLLDMIDERALETPLIPTNDHSYTSLVKSEPENNLTSTDEVGVCLHVSNNKVSLEFCPTCSENATEAWKRT